MITFEGMTSYMTAFPEEAAPFVLWENAFFNLALLVWCIVFFGIGFYMAQREFHRHREQGLKLAVKAILKDSTTAFEAHPSQMKPQLAAFVSRQTQRINAIEELGEILAKGGAGIAKASRKTVKVAADGGQGGLHSGAVNGGTVINLVVNQPQTIHQGGGSVEASATPMIPPPAIGGQPVTLSVSPTFPEDNEGHLYHSASRYTEVWQFGQSLIGLLLKMESQLFWAKKIPKQSTFGFGK